MGAIDAPVWSTGVTDAARCKGLRVIGGDAAAEDDSRRRTKERVREKLRRVEPPFGRLDGALLARLYRLGRIPTRPRKPKSRAN